MIPTQTPGPRLPPDEVRDGAACHRTGGGPGEASPVVSPGRSSATEQMCNQCRRSGGQMVTIAMGASRWRLCHICTGRANKTTVAKAVVCAHPYSRAHRDSTGPTTYRCIDCFDAVPGPPETSAEKRCTCAVCVEAGHASPALVFNAALFGLFMVSLAGATGRLRTWIEALPLPEPSLNGWPLFVLTITAGYVWWRMRNAVTTQHELDVLLDLDSTPCPCRGCHLNRAPSDDPSVDPWYGTSPFTDLPTDDDEVRS